MTHARSKTMDINLADDSYSSYYDDDSDLERQPTLSRKNLLRATLERLQAPGRRCDWRKGAPRETLKRNNIRRSQSLPPLKLPPSLLEEQDVFQDGEELESFELGFDQQTNDESYSQKLMSSYQSPHRHSTTSKSKDAQTPSICS